VTHFVFEQADLGIWGMALFTALGKLNRRHIDMRETGASGGGSGLAKEVGTYRWIEGVAADPRGIVHLREVGGGLGGLCEGRAAGAEARAAAVRKVYPRGLATRSAMRVWGWLAPWA
jgi:hypothetical protein